MYIAYHTHPPWYEDSRPWLACVPVSQAKAAIRALPTSPGRRSGATLGAVEAVVSYSPFAFCLYRMRFCIHVCLYVHLYLVYMHIYIYVCTYFFELAEVHMYVYTLASRSPFYGEKGQIKHGRRALHRDSITGPTEVLT